MTPASEPKQTSLGTSGGVWEAFEGYVGGIWEELWETRATTGGPEASWRKKLSKHICFTIKSCVGEHFVCTGDPTITVCDACAQL